MKNIYHLWLVIAYLLLHGCLCFSQTSDIFIKAEFVAVENAVAEKNAESANKHLNKLVILMASDSAELKTQKQQQEKNELYFQLSSLKASVTHLQFTHAQKTVADLARKLAAGSLQRSTDLIQKGIADQINSEPALFRKATIATDTILGLATLDSTYLQQFFLEKRISLAEIETSLKSVGGDAVLWKKYAGLNDATSYESAAAILGKIQASMAKDSVSFQGRSQQSLENEKRFVKLYLDYLLLSKYYVKAEGYVDGLITQKGVAYLQQLGLQETIIAVRNGAEKERRKIAFEKEKSDTWEQVLKDPSLENLKKYVDQYPDSRQAGTARLMIGSNLVHAQKYRYADTDAKYLEYFWDLDTASIAVDSIHALRMQKLSNAPSFHSLLYLNLEGIPFDKEDYLAELPKKAKKLQCLLLTDCSFLDNKIKKPLVLPRMSIVRINNSDLESMEELYAPYLNVLDISQNKLSRLPKLPELANQSLYYIDLSENEFKSVPGYVFDCTGLKSLDVSQNKITSIGRSLSKLQQLEYLNLSYNDIGDFPTDIFRMPNLKTLLLYGLPYSYALEGIENLKNLEILGLGGDIRQLPVGIDRLPELKGLYIANAPNIKGFPTIILECKKLETLYLSGITADTSLEKISRLRRIKSLYLIKSGFVSIPEFIYRMSNLEELNLSKNPIVSLDPRISELANMKAIHFDDCKLSAESLILLRFSLPNTDITYFDNQLGKNVLSKKISNVSWMDFKKKYEYYLEGDVESAYELGRYFDDRGDAGIAYIFYYFGAINKQLSGKAKGLINNLSVAEMYDKIEEQDKWTNAITLQNWRKLANYYYQTVSYKEYYNICTCTPRDDGGRKIKLNACNRILNLHNKVLSQLSGLVPEYERQFNTAMSGNRAALSNAKTWLNVGSIVDYTGVLGSFSGLGAVAGASLSAVSQSNAERLANEAASVTTTVDDMANKMKEINSKVAEIEGIILKFK